MGSLQDCSSARPRGAGSKFRVASVAVVAALAAALTGALALGGGHAGAEEYSAYADPQKTALSFVLSRENNVTGFQEEFDLSDEEVGEVLAAVRRENGRLAQNYAESERLISANKTLSDERISEKMAGSDYDETVEGAIAGTKESVTDLLPEGSEPRLRSWVDERWREEVKTASRDDAARVVETKGRRTLRCKVFATQYIGYTRSEVALPHRKLKFNAQPRVPINRVSGKGRTVKPRVKEVGPWNTRDNYWQSGKKRTMWRSLPRCKPEAAAAYYDNFHRGRDEFGRKVTNPAGADLTPRVARRMGLQKYQNAWVYVRFPFIRR